MPSPIGHVLGALAAGWALPARDQGSGAPRGAVEGSRGRRIRQAALLGGVALLPDLDLLFGAHSQWTHSVGAVALVFVLAWLATRLTNVRLAAAVAVAYATHPLLDWLGQDGTPPYGVMLGWPFTDRYFHSGADLFTGISRRYWLPGFLEHNAAAIAREVAILGPFALGAWWWQQLRRPDGRRMRFVPPASGRKPRGESRTG
jgi:membrane-bound metal-dependent hydrolase YbcI (DUF457 family)